MFIYTLDMYLHVSFFWCWLLDETLRNPIVSMCLYFELIRELSSKLKIAILEYLTTLIMPRIVLEYTFMVAWIGGLINELIRLI